MQQDDAIHFSDAYLTLDGQIAGTSQGGTLRLTSADMGEVVLSPLAQAQLLEHLYARRGQLYCLTTLDLSGEAAPSWIRSDPHFDQWLVDSTVAHAPSSSEDIQ